ncbi:hypothetical protein CDIK_2280 [Cucumispora dikerogammari]|nr:hypothetical protein CDIK_2280 [Cucumispora dikerogammari]
MLSLSLFIMSANNTPSKYDLSQKKQQAYLELFNDMKLSISKIHDYRKQMLEKFRTKFKELTENYFKSSDFEQKFSSADALILEQDEPDLSKLSPQYFSIQKVMRKLFFTDFISFYCEFFSSINRIILKEQEEGGRFHNATLWKMFDKLDSSNNFAKANDLNKKFIEFIETRIFPDISFTYLRNILESIVEKHSGNSTELIRKCLYFNPSFVFDVKSEQNISEFYHIIIYFFKHYEGEPYICDSEELKSHVASTQIPIEKAVSFLKVLIDHYKEYLIINIKLEYKSCRRLGFNPRFEKYKKHRQDLHSCCLKMNQNLMAISCDKHHDIINEIKKEFAENIIFDFKQSFSSYFNTVVEDVLWKFYDAYYKIVRANGEPESYE